VTYARPMAALLLALCACRGDPRAPAAPASRAAGLPSGWGRLAPVLRDAEAAQAAADAATLARLAPAIEKEGLSLLQANMPSTLAPHDVPRFLEARQAFGDALLQLARARESGAVPDLGPFVLRVSDAYHGWMSVIRGGPAERAL
jgi:hypothetical protein